MGGGAQTGRKELELGGPESARTRAEEDLHLKLFLRHVCLDCSEVAVAEAARQMHHVRRVLVHPERHEIEIWGGFPVEGIMREIAAIRKAFCCEMTACHVH